MSDAVLQLVARLEERLGRVRRRIYRVELTVGAARALALSVALVLGVLFLEAIFWFDPWLRTALVGAAGTSVATAWLYYAGRPLLRLAGWTTRMDLQDLARRIGDRFSAVSDRLVNLLQLARGQGSIGDEDLRERAIASLAREVEDVPFEEMASYENARVPARWAGLAIGLTSLAFLIAPSTMGGAFDRLAHPGATFERPAPFSWTVRPGDTTVVRGEAMRVRARATGSRLPDRAVLELRMEDGDGIETQSMQPDTAGRFTYRISQLRNARRYRVAGRDVESDWYRADLVSRPMVRRLQLRLSPPEYTGLPERSLPPDVGDVSALPGTRVDLTVRTDSATLRGGRLEFEERPPDTLALDGGSATTSFSVRGSDTYRIRLVNADGLVNADPIDYRIEALTDQAPSIEQLAPDRTTDIGGSATVDLRLDLADDYGFRDLRLYYRLAESRFTSPMDEFRSIALPLDAAGGVNRTVTHTWGITEEMDLDPVRGDVIEYYVRVRDNNAVAGYQPARTPTHTLRVPSLAQEYRQLEETQNSASTTLDSIGQQANQLHREFQNMQREIRRNREAGWENQQQAESLQERQQQVQDRVRRLEKQVESMNRRMEQSDLVSEETRRAYEELQQVIREIDSPELQEALQQMQEAMENVNFENLQQAMEEFSFNEEQYRERIERTRELFENIRTQQELEEAARRAQNLSELQRELSERTRELMERSDSLSSSGSQPPGDSADAGTQRPDSLRTGPTGPDSSGVAPSRDDSLRSSEGSGQTDRSESAARNDTASTRPTNPESLSGEQARARKLMQELERQLEEMQNSMSERDDSQAERMEGLRRRLREEELPRRMQENRRRLQDGQLQEAEQGQQSMGQQLEQLSRQLQEMKNSMQSQQMQINRAALRKTLEDVLVLSREQESVRNRLDEMATDSPALRSISRRQNAIQEGVRTVTDSLQNLARDIPQMSRTVQQVAGNALRALNQTMTRIQERDLAQAGASQTTGMQELNRLAVMLAQLLEQLDNMSQSGSGMSLAQMMDQIQQMAGQQQQLNQQLQQMLNDVQGNRLSRSQQEQLQQMQQRQEAIRKQLEELRRQGGDADGELLGQLDRVARQMEESIAEMRDRQVDPQTVDRQRQILSRLLQAQQSLRTQGQDDQRQGETAQQEARESPDALPEDASERDQLRRDLIRALESGYAPDYEELIKEYFQQLEETNGSTEADAASR